jgi:MYXO-CTERM domain-containing protein
MIASPQRWLSSVLYFIAVFHIGMGIGLTLSPGFQQWAAALYGAEIDWTDQATYFVRIIGTFALVVGLVALSAARRPATHAGVVVALAAFFLLRNGIRHVHSAELYAGFSVSSGVNLITSAFFGLLAAALLGLLWASRRRNSLAATEPDS